jgi:hypothetical protein
MTLPKKSSKVLELLKSGDSDKLSSSSLWFHLANIAVTIVYIMLGVAAFKMQTPNIEGMAIFTGIYAGIVTGNKFANTFLSYKYGANKDTPPKE